MKVYNNVLSVTLLLCGLTDFIRKFNVGGITALGLLTIVLALGSWCCVFTRYHKLPKIVLVASGLVLFIICAVLNWLWYYASLPAMNVIQNLSVYLAFPGMILLSIIQSYRILVIPEYISKTLPIAIKISVCLYALSVLIYRPGTGLIMAARSFALFAIVGCAWFMASWRYGLPGGWKWLALTILTIAFSFSRSALIIVILLFPISQFSCKTLKGWLRMGLTIAIIIIVSYLAFTYVEPIRSRFTDTGDNATVGGVQINTSGRNAAWPIAYASAWESPWIGKGPGSVGTVLVKSVGSAFSHPHNDYLRIFHDYGLIGLTLWLMGYGQLMSKTWQNWQWAERNDRDSVHIHLAAVLSLIGIALAMITDNVIVYIFVMAPLGILVGASLGSGNRRQKEIKSAQRIAILSNSSAQLVVKP